MKNRTMVAAGMSNRFFAAALGFLAMLQVPVVHASDCLLDDMPTPSSIDTSTVFENAVYNGVVLSVYEFQATQSVEQVLRFYKRKWKDQFSELRVGPWQQIVHIDDKCVYQVQVAGADEGSLGRLVLTKASEPPSKLRNPGAGVQWPNGTTVISDLASNDGVKTGRTIVANNKLSVFENLSHFQARYTADGWGIETAESISKAEVLVVVKGTKRASIALVPVHDRTQILFNEEVLR